jgi:hypothetical protein
MKFPSVKKGFGRIVAAERIGRRTVKLVGAALVAAGLVVQGAHVAKADFGQPGIQASWPGGVIVIPVAPAINLTDGTIVIADHFSHSSHASHASHVSHCSGYSYCG